MSFRAISLRLKLALSAAALTAVAITSLIALTMTLMSRSSTEEAKDRAQSLMGEYIAMIRHDIGRVTEAVSIGGAAVEAVIATGPVNRDALGSMVTEMLETRPDLVGMTLAFEPTALGDESTSIGHRYSDATGRFVPYFFYDPSKAVKVELLDMRPEAGTESWYDLPLREDRMLITPPYIYPVNGTDVMMTTVSNVIHRNGRPIGILTADMALADLSRKIESLRPFGEGRVHLASMDNQWIASDDPTLLGKPVSSAQQAYLAKREVQFVTIDGQDMMVLAAEVQFTGVAETWTVLMNVPVATVMAHVNATQTQALMAAAALLFLTLICVWFGAQMISRPIEGMTYAMKRLADGHLDTAIPHAAKRDEIGAMASAMQVFRDRALEARRLETEAVAIRAEREQARQTAAEQQNRVVREISTGLERLASGDMTYQIENPVEDPFPLSYDALRLAFNEVVTHLSQTIRRIAEVAQRVHNGSDKINKAAGALSSRAETQATTLRESAAALNEMNEIMRQTADRASEVERTSGENRDIALGSANIVRDAMKAMQGIERSSEQISRIIGVIDEIAFQTNLLALNAGVEAARAGDAGRGFAVVASEVRGLAQRAAESSREVRSLILESAAQVKTGVDLVTKTGQSLDVIVEKTADVSGQIAAISRAALDQSTNLNEINAGVGQLDQVTQQNAAVAEDTTAAAVSLRQQAETLAREIGAFRIG